MAGTSHGMAGSGEPWGGGAGKRRGGYSRARHQCTGVEAQSHTHLGKVQARGKKCYRFTQPGLAAPLFHSLEDGRPCCAPALGRPIVGSGVLQGQAHAGRGVAGGQELRREGRGVACWKVKRQVTAR